MDKTEFDKQMAEITAMAEEKSKELTVTHKREVTPMVFHNGEKFVVGYIGEPTRMVKMQAFDLYERSRTQAGDIVLRSSLIHDASDKEILDESTKNDAVYLGAINFACKLVTEALELLKKK